MKKTLAFGLLMVMSLSATAMAISAAGQIQKRINLSISAPFAIRMGEYLLPPGQYVLYQVLQNDSNLFALHPGELTNEPVALIRTARINYQSGQAPDDTMLFVEMDESSPDNHPVLQGWAIPGSDGWEVLGVVEKKTGFLTKVNDSSDALKAHKLDKSRLKFSKYEENDKRSKIKLRKID